MIYRPSRAVTYSDIALAMTIENLKATMKLDHGKYYAHDQLMSKGLMRQLLMSELFCQVFDLTDGPFRERDIRL